MPTPSPIARLVERLRLAFFRSFFSLLLAAIALSEWVVSARGLTRLGLVIPPFGHLAGALAIFACNRWLVRRLRRRAGGRLVAVYTAFAFTCVFGGAFVGLAELVWALARGAVALPRLAGLPAAADFSAWHRGF